VRLHVVLLFVEQIKKEGRKEGLGTILPPDSGVATYLLWVLSF